MINPTIHIANHVLGDEKDESVLCPHGARMISYMRSNATNTFSNGAFIAIMDDYQIYASEDGVRWQSIADIFDDPENHITKCSDLLCNNAIFMTAGNEGTSFNGCIQGGDTEGLYLNNNKMKECVLLPGWVYAQATHEDGTPGAKAVLHTIQGLSRTEKYAYLYFSYFDDAARLVFKEGEDKPGNIFLAEYEENPFYDEDWKWNCIGTNIRAEYSDDRLRTIAVKNDKSNSWSFRAVDGAVIHANPMKELSAFVSDKNFKQTAKQILYSEKYNAWFVINDKGSNVLISKDNGETWEEMLNPFVLHAPAEYFGVEDNRKNMGEFAEDIEIIGLAENDNCLFAFVKDHGVFVYNPDGRFSFKLPSGTSATLKNAFFVPVEDSTRYTTNATAFDFCTKGNVTYVVLGGNNMLTLDTVDFEG